MGDVFNAISEQGFRPDQPYPDGVYTCDLTYFFPSRSVVTFGLKLEKVAAPGWHMTFADISDDLEALYYSALWFEDRPAAMPKMNVEVHRFKVGSLGPTFLASKGNLSFDLAVRRRQCDSVVTGCPIATPKINA